MHDSTRTREKRCPSTTIYTVCVDKTLAKQVSAPVILGVPVLGYVSDKLCVYVRQLWTTKNKGKNVGNCWHTRNVGKNQATVGNIAGKYCLLLIPELA